MLVLVLAPGSAHTRPQNSKPIHVETARHKQGNILGIYAPHWLPDCRILYCISINFYGRLGPCPNTILSAPKPPPCRSTPKLAPTLAFYSAMGASLSQPGPTSQPQTIATAEASLLRLLTDVPYERRLIRLPSGHSLSTLSAGDAGKPPLVLLHGWGAGGAFFGKNITRLSRHFRLHVVDWLGFGASSRPDHPLWLDPVAAEAFFVDALAEWMEIMREREDVDTFHVVGHSMGAFLSVSYALRYPKRVRSLVLASPVGLPRPPQDKVPAGGWIRRTLFKLVFILWERGYTPQYLLRTVGAKVGRYLADWIISPRFPTADLRVREAFTEYFYQISAAGSSGEHSLSTILESGAYARRPLFDRLQDVCAPTVFLYGDRDWMSSDVAEKVRQGMSVRTRVEVVKEAGHHIYYDNPEDFGRLIEEACMEMEEPRTEPVLAAS